MDAMLSSLQPGLLGPHIEPLKARIRMLMETGDHTADEVVRRVRLMSMASRPFAAKHFETVASALLNRQRLSISHYNRRTDERHEREVSPQRLVS